MEIYKIVKEKLKEIEGYRSLEDLGESDEEDWEKLIELKATIKGIQIAIKSELKKWENLREKYFEDLDSITNDKSMYDYLDEIRIFIDGKIADCKNALKLIENEKR